MSITFESKAIARLDVVLTASVGGWGEWGSGVSTMKIGLKNEGE